jgi:hypothetical protein
VCGPCNHYIESIECINTDEDMKRRENSYKHIIMYETNHYNNLKDALVEGTKEHAIINADKTQE